MSGVLRSGDSMTPNQTPAPLVIAVDVVWALYVITVRDAAIIISRVRQHPADPPQVLIEGCEHFLQSQSITACHQLLLVVVLIR
jgi:hypothetical protein